MIDRETLGQMKNKLTTLEKMQMAEELVNMAAVEDEQRGLIMWSHIKDYIYMVLKLKWYCGMDISGYLADGREGIARLYDEVNADEELKTFLTDSIWPDFLEVDIMADDLFENVKESYEKEHSLEYAIKTSFGFLFTGEDLTQSMSEAREVTEQMITHFGEIMKARDVLAGKQTVNLSQYAKK